MTMSSFTKSAPYYDLFYKDKDYVGETNKIHTLIQHYRPSSKNILDLGCGTGEHAKYLTRFGYSVTGIDNSSCMLRIAKRKFLQSKELVKLKKADITTYRSNNPFGVAVSLFHVFSYLITNKDVLAFFSSTFNNLENGGLFIFDCWYGPGVLTSPPEVQTSTGACKEYIFTKTKHPIHKKKEHIVEVTHDTAITWQNGKQSHVQETHRLRYFFYTEIKKMLTQSGFTVLSWGDIQNSFAAPKKGSWDVTFVAQKPFSKK